MERVAGIEPTLPPWKGGVIAFIRYPPYLYFILPNCYNQPMPSPDLSVVLVNFHTPELTLNCIESLSKTYHNNKIDLQLVLVEVQGEDDFVGQVRRKYPWVIVEETEENYGFGGNNNLALPYATGRYILFLNSDTEVPEETLPEMVEFFGHHPDVAAATCYLELKSGGMDPDCHRGLPYPWSSFTYFTGLENLFPRSRVFGQYHKFYLPLDKVHQIEACCGAFLMLRRSVLEDLVEGEECGRPQFWDEKFFFYGEDLDVCKRLKDKDYKLFFYPHVKVYHYKGASSGIRKESAKITKASLETRVRVLSASAEAMKLYFKKHYKDKYPHPVYWLVMQGINILQKLRALRGRR
jgi:GT2 family glycosyltransferase